MKRNHNLSRIRIPRILYEFEDGKRRILQLLCTKRPQNSWGDTKVRFRRGYGRHDTLLGAVWDERTGMITH